MEGKGESAESSSHGKNPSNNILNPGVEDDSVPQAESKSQISQAENNTSSIKPNEIQCLSIAASSKLAETENPETFRIAKMPDESSAKPDLKPKVLNLPSKHCVDIEDYLHGHTEELYRDNVYFNVVIFGGKGVGKKTLRKFKPLLKNNGLQLNVTIKAELKHTIMMRLEIPDNRPKGYQTSKEEWLKIQLTFITVEDRVQGNVSQMVKKKDDGQMYILMFDLTQKSSLSSLESLEKLSVENSSIHAILIGNKMDLVEKRVVDKEDINNLCKKLNCSQYGEISALTGKGVMEEVWLQIMRVRKDWMHKRMAILIQETKEKKATGEKEAAKREQELITKYPHFRDPENCDDTCKCIVRLEESWNCDEQDDDSDGSDE